MRYDQALAPDLKKRIVTLEVSDIRTVASGITVVRLLCRKAPALNFKARKQMVTQITTQEKITVGVDEKLEMAKWHTQRYDSLRASTANRAAMVLSANALLLAGSTFLLDKIVTNTNLYGSYERPILLIGISLTLALLAISIFYSIKGIIAVSKTSRELFGHDIPKRLFFHHRDTIESFIDFQSFEQEFMGTDPEKQLFYALGNLWTIINQHFYRYQSLRTAIKLLSLGIVCFLISAFTMILCILF